MFDVRYFTRSLYVVLLLGLLGYAIALESPIHFLLGLVCVVPHAVLRKTGGSFVLPRFASSLIAILSGVWSTLGAARGAITPLMAVSQWLFALLLVTLWGKPSNRASGQMLVMSLVLMVAGAINSADVIYGTILVFYLFLSLYCCLLFHLKVETEQAFSAYHLSSVSRSNLAVRHDQSHFGRSMRCLTALVCTVSVTMGVLVFLFFPRAKAPSLLAQLTQMQPTQQAPMTGFSEHISFNQVARITQNTDTVARIAVTDDGKPVRGNELFLRGLALDVYTGHVRGRQNMSWQWVRSPGLQDGAQSMHLLAKTEQPLQAPQPRKQIRQSILLQPTGTPAIFAMPGAYAISADRDLDMVYNGIDHSLRCIDIPKTPLQYEVVSSGEMAAAEPALAREANDYFTPTPGFPPPEMPAKSQIDPRIRAYARQASVSGTDQNGPLYRQRRESDALTPLDGKIAESIRSHLQSSFSYTLDLTDTKRERGQDPLAQFLYDFRKGHCEYFAGAMTLMCQSLGLQARVVIGFKAGFEDYNDMGHYYLIKQSNAHAWVEVLTTEGWKTFDPTAASTEGFVMPTKSLWRKTKDIFDYLQYLWATQIVTYGNENRVDLLQSIDNTINARIDDLKSMANAAREFLHSEQGYMLSTQLLTWGIGFSLLTLASSVVIFLVEKRRMFRRAERIGISSLPASDQLRLARQLGFYDELLLLLSRLRIGRDPGLTHLEFAQSLDFLPAEPYQQIRRLTRIFYRVRFGQYQLSSGQRRHLAVVLNRLQPLLTQHQAQRIVVKHAS